jgi:hypothetical protein
MGHQMTGCTKPMLVRALQDVQHFRPPNLHRQSKQDLERLVRSALNSERYGGEMRAALASAKEALGR